MFGRWFKRPRSSAEHPWMDDVAGLVEAFGYQPRRRSNALEVAQGEATTEIRFRPSNVVCRDGAEVEGTFEIVTQFGRDVPASIASVEAAAVLNVMASLGAVVSGNGAPTIKSRLTIYREDHRAKTLYVPLVACAVVSNARVFASTLAGAMGEKRPVARDPLRDDGPSRWKRADFTTAEEFLMRAGILATSSDTGLTAEFSWDPGAISMAQGAGRTSLVQLESGAEHPTLGGGLFAKLDIPISFSPDEAPRIADLLNRREFESVDAPPFFGAWCSRPGTGDVTFVSFLPNLLYHPGNVANVAVWMQHRAAMAKECLAEVGADPTPRSGDVNPAGKPKILRGALAGTGATVLAIDVTEPLESYRVQADEDAHTIAAVGRLMSVAAAVAALQPEASTVAVTALGNGPRSPVHVRINVAKESYSVTTGQDDTFSGGSPVEGLRASAAIGTEGTLSVVLHPSGEEYIVPLTSGEIGAEFAALLADTMDLPAAAIVGEYFLRDGVKGSGMVLVCVPPELPPADVAAAEAAVNRFGRVSPRIAAGESPEEWLRSFSPLPPHEVPIGPR